VISTVGASVSADAGETTASAISDTASPRIDPLTTPAKKLFLLISVVMVFVLALIVGHLHAGWIAEFSGAAVDIMGACCPQLDTSCAALPQYSRLI
jgi:hypothetical protein